MSEPIGSSVEVLPPAQGERAGEGRGVPWGATWVLLLSLSAVVSGVMVVVLHSERGFFLSVLATAVCVLAALFDAWTTRIPNALTYTAILLGLAMNGAASAMAGHEGAVATVGHLLGAPGITQSLLGFGVCAVLGILGLTVARVGGGDIKLLAGLAALLGLADIASVLLVALGVAVVYSVVNLAVFGRLNSFAKLLAIRVLEVIYLRRLEAFPVESDATERPRHDTVPMAVPLAIGLIVAQGFDLTARLGMR